MKQQSGSILIPMIAILVAIMSAASLLLATSNTSTSSMVEQYIGTKSFQTASQSAQQALNELARYCDAPGSEGIHPEKLINVASEGTDCSINYYWITSINADKAEVAIYKSGCDKFELIATDIPNRRRLVKITDLVCEVPVKTYTPEYIDSLPNRVTICHKLNNEITISKSALKAHLDHGDAIDSCINVTSTILGRWSEPRE